MIFDGLSIGFIFLIGILCLCLGAVFVLIFQRSKGGLVRKEEEEEYKKQQEEKRKTDLKNAQSVRIRDFMEFDKVEDDMIVQNDGTRFVMAIKCMGINYDLMSEAEMLAVEEGFVNFLNTLKDSIQLYVQARSLDLSEGINQYHSRLNDLKDEYDKYIDAVNRTKASNLNLTMAQKQQMDFEIRKKKNLYEYGADIVSYIEKMSMNRNILQRKYFIIVSYETAEMGMTTNFSKAEAKDVAYSVLYTRCKTIQAAIAPCGIETSILKSDELAELLHIAYNKDDADVGNIKQQLNSGIYRLYSTAQSVMEKKKEAMDAKIKEDAIVQAELALKTAMDELKNNMDVDINSLTEEEQYEDDTKREAMQMILENQERFDPEVVDKALENLNSSMHNPLVSEEELEEAEKMAAEEFHNHQMKNKEDDVNNFTTKDELDNLLNGNPIDSYLN